MALFLKREKGKLKFLWGFKQKAIAGVLALILVLTVGIVGVIAFTSQNAKLSTRVTFRATDVSVSIYMKATHVGGGENAADLDLSMTGATPAVDPYYTYMVDIKPNTQANSINIVIPAQNLKEMGQTKTLPDGNSSYTSYVKYDFKIVNNSSKNVRVKYTYNLYDTANTSDRGVEYNNTYLNFMAMDSNGIRSAAMTDSIDILSANSAVTNEGASVGYAMFTNWINVVDQAMNAPETGVAISIDLTGADDDHSYDGASVTKGDILAIDTNDDGTPEQYRVINVDGNEIMLMGMASAKTMNYDAGGDKAIFEHDTHWAYRSQQAQNDEYFLVYNGSDIDNYLNGTGNSNWYGSRSATFKDAVIPQNIIQRVFTSKVDESVTSSEYKVYRYRYMWNDRECGLARVAKNTVNNRNVFCIGIDELYQYFDIKYSTPGGKITQDDIRMLFWNDVNSHNEVIWLNSVATSDREDARAISGNASAWFTWADHSYNLSVRPAFVLDLSKIAYTVVSRA